MDACGKAGLRVNGEASVITGGTLATEYGTFRADIVVRGGRIEALLDSAEGLSGDRIDAAGMVIFPGGVDMHTHLLRRKASSTGDNPSYHAAAGGITTVMEMPQGERLVCDLESLGRKRELAARSAVTDYGLFAAAIGQDAGELELLRREGVLAFKAFTCQSSPGFPMLDEAGLRRTMYALHRLDTPLIVHAEDDELLREGLARMRSARRTDPRAHAESRPPTVEAVAVDRVLQLALQSGARVHVAHVSTGRAARAIGVARAAGAAVSCETCPQYLVLDQADLERLGPVACCAPPLRERAEVEELWTAVAHGAIDALCSDHSPYSAAEKAAGAGDIFQTPMGLNIIEVMLASIVDEGIHRRGMSWTHFANLAAAQPARLLGLYPAKGSMRVGADADLAFWDLGQEWEVHSGGLVSGHLPGPLDGRRLRGRVVRTIRRGETIYIDGAVCAQPGSGRFLPPGYR